MARPDWYCDDVLSGKLTVKKIWEDERVLVFYHPDQNVKYHALVIPKKHISSIMDQAAIDSALLTSMVTGVQKAAIELGLDQKGFFVRTNAVHADVTPHMHWHVQELEKSFGM